VDEVEAMQLIRQGIAELPGMPKILEAAPPCQGSPDIAASHPLVTCVMPTANRARFLPRALASFLSQTYTNLELVVLDDGAERFPWPEDPRIRYVRSERAASLGHKRNMLGELARGEFLCHFDDDDWSAPDRIEVQLRELLSAGAEVTGFTRMLFWDERRRAAFVYTGDANYVLGTSLFYRKSWWDRNRFPSLNSGEDFTMFRRARSGRCLRSVEGEGLMVATTHSRGTSPRKMDSLWRPVDRSLIPTSYWSTYEPARDHSVKEPV